MLKTCETCGNDIEADASVCPFCESPQTPAAQQNDPQKPLVGTIFLKEGNPTVAEAIAVLNDEIVRHKAVGIRLIRVIHGYGSSGVGGAIRKGVRQHLARLQKMKEVSDVITGEEHFERGARHSPLLRKYPELRETWHQDRGNMGITFVEL